MAKAKQELVNVTAEVVNTSRQFLSHPIISDPMELLALAKAQKEAALAASAEHDYRKKDGQYLQREFVREASAKAYASIAQSCRSIPDIISRKISLPSAQLELMSDIIDESLAALSRDLEDMFNTSAK